MARYADAVEWIAANEETMIDSADEMADDVCVLLVADVFKKFPTTVAADVIRRRRKIFAGDEAGVQQ